MRRSIGIIAAALLLAPFLAAQAAPVVVELTYLSPGHYIFRKQEYSYATVVKVIKAAYQGEQIDLVSVNMPQGTSLIDRQNVCHLKQDLGTRLKMHLDVGDGTTAPQFCN
jgi:hypothetical protein